MIGHALVAAIRHARSDLEAYPGLAPKGIDLPWVVFRQIDRDETEGFSCWTQDVTFEIDSAAVKGLEPEHYEKTKQLANDIRLGLREGFDHAGVCVYRAEVGKEQDMIDDTDGLYWTRTIFKFTFDTPI